MVTTYLQSGSPAMTVRTDGNPRKAALLAGPAPTASGQYAAVVAHEDGTRSLVRVSAPDRYVPPRPGEGRLGQYATAVSLSDGTRALARPWPLPLPDGYYRIAHDADGNIRGVGLRGTGHVLDAIDPATLLVYEKSVLVPSRYAVYGYPTGVSDTWAINATRGVTRQSPVFSLSNGNHLFANSYHVSMTRGVSMDAAGNSYYIGGHSPTGNPGYCHAHSYVDGSELWTRRRPNGYQVIAIDGTNVYALGDALGTAQVDAYNAATGAIVYQHDYPMIYFQNFLGSDDSGNLWCFDASYMYQFDAATGGGVVQNYYAPPVGMATPINCTDPTGYKTQCFVLGVAANTPYLWVPDSAGYVHQWDITGTAWVASHDIGMTILDLAVDADGNCWVALQSAPYLVKIEPS